MIKLAKSISVNLLVISAFLLLPSIADAATLYFSPSSGSYNVGQTFSVNVYVSSSEQAMNAASGVISFPIDKLRVTSISKAGSIFTFWAQEPSFSNANGTINFEGVVFNPGFTGPRGRVINITFRTRAAGNASLAFSSGAILANDGMGTNILTGMGNANFVIGVVEREEPEIIIPTEVVGVPVAPKIISLTHPDSNKWYAVNDAKFTWDVPEDVTAVRLLVGRAPDAIPTVAHIPPISERELTNLADGVWYFSARFRNEFGWGRIGRFKLQIDTVAPLPFEIKVKEGEKTTNPQPTLMFETTDETSGIDYYEIKINLAPPIRTTVSEYQIPIQQPGKRTIIVKAVDKAGNYTLAMTEIEILPIEAPIITDYPRQLLPGSILSIRGTALPEATVRIYLQRNKNIKVTETKSDYQGRWAYTWIEAVQRGRYRIWTETIDIFGATSRPSEKAFVLVSPPILIRIGWLAIDYLTAIKILLILMAAMALALFWTRRDLKYQKQRSQEEITEAEKALYRAFKALKKEMEKQVAKLDGKPNLNARERKIYEALKASLEHFEKTTIKEIHDIEKIMR